MPSAVQASITVQQLHSATARLGQITVLDWSDDMNNRWGEGLPSAQSFCAECRHTLRHACSGASQRRTTFSRHSLNDVAHVSGTHALVALIGKVACTCACAFAMATSAQHRSTTVTARKLDLARILHKEAVLVLRHPESASSFLPIRCFRPLVFVKGARNELLR